MKYSVLEKTLIDKLDNAIMDVTPGVVVRAYQGGKSICNVSVGNTYPYYDLASLTKVIFTVQSMMLLYDQEKWNLETTVSSILPWFKHEHILVRDLLTHSSGLEWWLPFYKDLDTQVDLLVRRESLKKVYENIQLKPSEISVYSDVGFILLSFVMEEIFQKNLIDIWSDIKSTFYEGTTLNFHLQNKPIYEKKLYAPTEECPWRKRLIQGEVHDENTWALGGISTHAGLFGSIDDLSWYALSLRSQVNGIAKYHIRQKTAKLFTKRARQEGKGDWTLGFMMPTPETASCGVYFSSDSVGHTGFTGTSVWYDPVMDMLICILSNRVLYGRNNDSFKALRPQIHNWIVEGYRRSGY